MTSKRTPIRRPQRAQLAEAVVLFERALELGERHRDYLDVKRRLDRATGRGRPWLYSALDVTGDSNRYPGYHQQADIPGAVRLRKALEAAVRERAR
jgi:hypothetical protein